MTSVRCISGERLLIAQPTYSFVVDRFDDVCYLNLGPTLQLQKCCAPKRKFIVSELHKTDDCSGFGKKPNFSRQSVRTFCRNPRICTVREFVKRWKNG